MVSVTLVGTDVIIGWQKPDENFAEITSYAIELRAQDGSWVSDNINCDGGEEPNFTNLNCAIPMIDI